MIYMYRNQLKQMCSKRPPLHKGGFRGVLLFLKNLPQPLLVQGGEKETASRFGAWTMPLLAVLASICTGCASPKPLRLEPLDTSTNIMLHAPEPVGRIKLWVPEAIVSERGLSAVYPVGKPWEQHDGQWRQRVTEIGIIGPGNCPLIDERTFLCAGIRIGRDSMVRWETRVTPRPDGADFEIELTNTGRQIIQKAAAPICIHLVDGANWWSAERAYVMSEGKAAPLEQLGWTAGQPNSFQAFLLEGVTFDNVFYREFWGFNPNPVERATIVSEHTDGKHRVAVSTDNGYFVHCNKGNPCTDLMLAFGDVEPKQTAVARGRVRVSTRSIRSLLAQ